MLSWDGEVFEACVEATDAPVVSSDLDIGCNKTLAGS